MPLSLIDLLKDKEVMVGAIDVASLEVESAEEVAATIRSAMRFVGPERMYPCTNCARQNLDAWQSENATREV